MEEDEIEQQYADEKQKALDDYLKDLKNNKNLEESEKIFNSKMDDVMDKYNRLMTEKISNKGKNNKFKDVVDGIISKFNLIKRK